MALIANLPLTVAFLQSSTIPLKNVFCETSVNGILIKLTIN